MRFDYFVIINFIDQGCVVGCLMLCIDGLFKIIGMVFYVYEYYEFVFVVGFVVGVGIVKGCVVVMDLCVVCVVFGVLVIVMVQNVGKFGQGSKNMVKLFGGFQVDYYYQVLVVVVVEIFEQVCVVVVLIDICYEVVLGCFDLVVVWLYVFVVKSDGQGGKVQMWYGYFELVFVQVFVQLDVIYIMFDQGYVMMELYVIIVQWEGQKLMVWMFNQMVGWVVGDFVKMLGIVKDNVYVKLLFVGGGFGGKFFLCVDVVLVVLGVWVVGWFVKIVLMWLLMFNNIIYWLVIIQCICIGVGEDGCIIVIVYESWLGDLFGGKFEMVVNQMWLFYVGVYCYIVMYFVVLDLFEGNVMWVFGEVLGLMVLEIVIDEMVEKLDLDLIEFWLCNDIQVDFEKLQCLFLQCCLVECLKLGVDCFGWSCCMMKLVQMCEGQWLVGLGMVGVFCNNLVIRFKVCVCLDVQGCVIVEMDMIDIGMGSYIIIVQIVVEMMGVILDCVVVCFGDLVFLVFCGLGGQWGGNNFCVGVYVVCMKLCGMIVWQVGLGDDVIFVDGEV